jgi:hypothetical protein
VLPRFDLPDLAVQQPDRLIGAKAEGSADGVEGAAPLPPRPRELEDDDTRAFANPRDLDGRAQPLEGARSFLTTAGHEPIETYSNGVRHVNIPDPDGNAFAFAAAAARPRQRAPRLETLLLELARRTGSGHPAQAHRPTIGDSR